MAYLMLREPFKDIIGKMPSLLHKIMNPGGFQTRIPNHDSWLHNNRTKALVAAAKKNDWKNLANNMTVE